jgi:hypothetical protein
MKTQELLALKNDIRERVRRRPGYRSIGVVRDAVHGDQVQIDVEADADLALFGDVVGKRDGVTITVRRASGEIKADRLTVG